MNEYTERPFIIRNDIWDTYKILDTDDLDTQARKIEMRQRSYATYDEETKTWTMRLPHWFTDSDYEEKCMRIDTFSYFKPDGTADIGTTLHSDTLVDSEFSQYDDMIGLSTDDVDRIFFIKDKPDYVRFWFKDYMSLENLEESEMIEEQKKNEKGELLYEEVVPSITKVTSRPSEISHHTTLMPVVSHFENKYLLFPEGEDPLMVSDYNTNGEDKFPVLIQDTITEDTGITQPAYYQISEKAECWRTTTETELPVIVRAQTNGKELWMTTEGQLVTSPSATDTPLFTYDYDAMGNQLFWQVFETTTEETTMPVLETCQDMIGRAMYAKELTNDWQITTDVTNYPIYIPKWNDPKFSEPTRYYTFREGISHRRTTNFTELPAYSQIKNKNGEILYAQMNNANEFLYVTTKKEDLCRPIYVQETTTSGQLIFWETVAQTTVDTGEPAMESKKKPATFVIVCRLYC